MYIKVSYKQLLKSYIFINILDMGRAIDTNKVQQIRLTLARTGQWLSIGKIQRIAISDLKQLSP